MARKFQGDGYLHEKPQRRAPCDSRPLVTLAGFQCIHGEFEGREIPSHPEVMVTLDPMIKALGKEIDPTPHNGHSLSPKGLATLEAAADQDAATTEVASLQSQIHDCLTLKRTLIIVST
jgi:hypothetical protein